MQPRINCAARRAESLENVKPLVPDGRVIIIATPSTSSSSSPARLTGCGTHPIGMPQLAAFLAPRVGLRRVLYCRDNLRRTAVGTARLVFRCEGIGRHMTSDV